MQENKEKLVYLINGILLLILPFVAILVYLEDISQAFRMPFENPDNTGWFIGTIVVAVICVILGAFSIQFAKWVNKNRPRPQAIKVLALVFCPIFVLATVGGTVYFAIEIVEPDRGPYLSWNSDPTTTMTITWERKEAVDSILSYYAANGDQTPIEVEVEPGPLREFDLYYHYTVTLTGLEPDTKYYYEIDNFRDPAWFKTAPDSIYADFSFIAYGDSREPSKNFNNQHIPLVQRMLEMVDLEEVGFVISTGDTTRTHDYIRGWNLHFLAIQDLASRVPYMVAGGNHEWDRSDEISRDWSQQPARLIQEFPHTDTLSGAVASFNNLSYAFGYAGVYMIQIEYPDQWYYEADYLDWLNEQLEIGNSTYQFTIVSFHNPPFDHRESGYNDDVQIIQNLCPLFHHGGVDMVINGHNHNIQRHQIRLGEDLSNRNITYVISGGGGANLREPMHGIWANNYSAGFYGETVMRENTNGYHVARVNGQDGIMEITAYNLNNEIIDEFTLESFKNL